MRLPLAIHTARQGYGWLNSFQHDIALLERFRKAIGKMTDIDYGEPLSCGALNVDPWVIVYRFMVEKGGDFRGRDCLYLALTYFQRSVASSIHIARLLEVPALSVPLRDAPTTLDYKAGDSAPYQRVGELDSADLLKSVDFATAGSAFQHPFEGVLHLQQYDGQICQVSFRSNRQSLVEAQHVPACEKTRTEQRIDKTYQKNVRQIWQDRAGWAAVVVAFLVIAWLLDMQRESIKTDVRNSSPMDRIGCETQIKLHCMPFSFSWCSTNDLPLWSIDSLLQPNGMIGDPAEYNKTNSHHLHTKGSNTHE